MNILYSSDSDSSAAAESSDEELNQDKRKKARVPKLYEARDERHADVFVNNRSLANEDILPIGERVAALPDHHNSHFSRDVKLGPGGSREKNSFISRSSAKYRKIKRKNEKEREGESSPQSDRSGSGGRGRGGGGRGRGGGGGFRGKSRGG